MSKTNLSSNYHKVTNRKLVNEKILKKSAERTNRYQCDTQHTLNLEKTITLKFDKAIRDEKLEHGVLYILLGLSALYLLYTITHFVDLSIAALEGLYTFNMVFLSILLQAIPFVLIGILVSSVLHVAISSEALVKIFPQKKGLGFVTAIFAGVFFPVCDCVIVPVAARLIKKGVSLPVAITFMLAAPVVNPVVIASTLYAFPKQPSLAIYRVCFGIFVALIVGLLLMLFQSKESNLKNNSENVTGCCECCKSHENTNVGVMGKIRLIFIYAQSEFFQIGKFLIIGAFFSSLFQTCISKNIFNNLWGHEVVSLLVMMSAAFVFSICSTSDAFIAKAFSSQFSTASIMGFLVLGPMIDIKNMLMLLASFKKRFVCTLILTIFVVTFIALYFTIILQ